MTTLSTVLKTATVGSRELDAMIAQQWLNRIVGTSEFTGFKYYVETGEYLPVPPWSTDLTACVALVQEKLPGWKWGVHGAAKEFEAYCIRMPSASGPAVIGRLYKESALTPCIAILRALDAALREVGSEE